jgi:hypothetical protein
MTAPLSSSVVADRGDRDHLFVDHKEALMTIVLDHTIVPARDKEESARFFARIFGLEYKGPVSHFAPVRINDTLTIDFDKLGRLRAAPLRLQGQRSGV